MRRNGRNGRESECVRLARRLARLPCNRSGADKTWVVELTAGLARLFSRCRPAGRV